MVTANELVVGDVFCWLCKPLRQQAKQTSIKCWNVLCHKTVVTFVQRPSQCQWNIYSTDADRLHCNINKLCRLTINYNNNVRVLPTVTSIYNVSTATQTSWSHNKHSSYYVTSFGTKFYYKWHINRGVARGPCPPDVDWVDFLRKKLALLGRRACFIQ